MKRTTAVKRDSQSAIASLANATSSTLLILRPLVRIQPGAPPSHRKQRLSAHNRMWSISPGISGGLRQGRVMVVATETGERLISRRFWPQSPTHLFLSTDGLVAMRLSEPKDATLL